MDHEDYRDPIYSPTVFVVDETALSKSTRKSFFKKRGVRKAPSAQVIDIKIYILFSAVLKKVLSNFRHI